jgi:hypothetical protein
LDRLDGGCRGRQDRDLARHDAPDDRQSRIVCLDREPHRQSGSHGIRITAGDVLLDLNGFVLGGAAGSRSGIVAPSPLLNITIQNGTIRSWGSNGVDVLSSTNCVLTDLRVMSNSADGINAGFASRVSRCIAAYNGDGLETNEIGDGIEVENSSVVVHCIAVRNEEHGMDAHSGTTIRGCVLLDNHHDGIHGSHGMRISDCVAQGNSEGIEVDTAGTIERCVSSYSVEDGFRDIAGGCVMRTSIAFLNGDDGLDIDEYSFVTECIAYTNAQEGIEASEQPGVYILRNVASLNSDEGIKIDGQLCRIDQNHVINNGGDGIRAKDEPSTTNNIVVRNVSDDFNVQGTNHFEVINDPGTTEIDEPWTNIEL